MNQANEPPQLALIEAAFQEAARDVLRIAKQTGTPIVVWKDGRVQEIPADQFDDLNPARPQQARESVPDAGPVTPS